MYIIKLYHLACSELVGTAVDRKTDRVGWRNILFTLLYIKYNGYFNEHNATLILFSFLIRIVWDNGDFCRRGSGGAYMALVWAQKNDVFHLKICLKMSSFSIKWGKNKGKSLVFAKKSKKYLVGIWKVRTFAFAAAEKKQRVAPKKEFFERIT